MGVAWIAAGAIALVYAARSGHLDRAHAALRDEESWRRVSEHVNSFALLALEFRLLVVIPFLRFFVMICAFMSALVAADRIFHFYVALYWRWVSRVDPKARWRFQALPEPGSVSAENVRDFPNVVVQLPMFNEKEVCQAVIDAACALDWPKSRMMVQVLDDSTCAETRRRIEDKVFEHRERGVNVQHRTKTNRGGYKAGAMNDAMADIEQFDHCAVFDADFDPAPDFLRKTIPYLTLNPDVGFVQARWVYSNGTESLLTRVQEISLNYHIRCEQYARHAAGLFFNFNGTAGVWRRECIVDSGGWNCRTTVEDMDLSLRAYLRGWRFVFLDDVTCLNEIPAQYGAYRKQQHRWSCGPMQLWRQAIVDVWNAKDVPLAKKLYLNVFFFGTRMFATHLVSFFLYGRLIPICATAPEVAIPFWALVYMPLLITLSTVWFTPGGWVYFVPYVLYENAMMIVKTSAMCAGLLQWSNAHEWVVTAKLGKFVDKVQHSKVGEKVGRIATAVKTAVVKRVVKKRNVYGKELAMGCFFLTCAAYGTAVNGMWQYGVFLCLQGGVFVAFGLDYVDSA